MTLDDQLQSLDTLFVTFASVDQLKIGNIGPRLQRNKFVSWRTVQRWLLGSTSCTGRCVLQGKDRAVGVDDTAIQSARASVVFAVDGCISGLLECLLYVLLIVG